MGKQAYIPQVSWSDPIDNNTNATNDNNSWDNDNKPASGSVE